MGVPASAFGLDEQLAFASAVTSSIGAPAGSTYVDSVVDSVVARRTLQASSGATVSFSVVTDQASAATSLSSGLSALASDPSSFTTALNAAFAAIPGGSSIPPLSAASMRVSAPVVATSAVDSVDVTTVANVTAATAAVGVAFANLSSSAAGLQQQSFLTSLASGTVNINMSSAAASTAVSLVFAIVTAANVTMSDASQSAALNILSRAAATTQLANSSVAQDVVSVLALVASSAVTSSNGGSKQSQNALQAVVGVVETLTGSQAAALHTALNALPPGAPPPEPSITSTPSIQTRVQVDPAGSSRLTTQPLTVVGSPSSFDPMPADLLPSAAPVVTTFVSLAFDPNAGGGSNSSSAIATTGLTRLAFSNPDGSPIEVANALTPIKFTLPRVNTSGDNQAVCAFWDVDAKVYSTRGCVGIPQPAPPGHNLSWVAGFTAANDSALAWAWNLTGELLDGCRSAVIDCNEAQPRKIFPDPTNPLTVPAIACPPRTNVTNATQPLLRVYYGAACQLWQPTNTLNCSWDAIKQAFIGGGCVSSGPTQCMCRHVRC